jgi:hypothetical protein
VLLQEDIVSFEDLKQGKENLIGKTLGGRYFVEREIGTGGTSAVYLVTRQMFSKPAAVKLLHIDLAKRQHSMLELQTPIFVMKQLRTHLHS